MKEPDPKERCPHCGSENYEVGRIDGVIFGVACRGCHRAWISGEKVKGLLDGLIEKEAPRG